MWSRTGRRREHTVYWRNPGLFSWPFLQWWLAESCNRQHKIPFSSHPVELLSFQFCIYSSVLKSGATEQRMLCISRKNRNLTVVSVRAQLEGLPWGHLLGAWAAWFPLSQKKHHGEVLSCLVVANLLAWGCAVKGKISILLISVAVKIIKTSFVKGLHANLSLRGLDFCLPIDVLDINPVSLPCLSFLPALVSCWKDRKDCVCVCSHSLKRG